MEQVLEGCREIPVAIDASQGMAERSKSRVKRLWNGAEIEEEIKRLKTYAIECCAKFTVRRSA
jgi:hypothetical protein